MQHIHNAPCTKATKEHYTECYLMLAKLVLAMLQKNTDLHAHLIDEALSYLFNHCSFCGEASDLTTLKDGLLQVIVCQDCYTKPLNFEVACRVLNDPSLKALLPDARSVLVEAMGMRSSPKHPARLRAVK